MHVVQRHFQSVFWHLSLTYACWFLAGPSKKRRKLFLFSCLDMFGINLLSEGNGIFVKIKGNSWYSFIVSRRRLIDICMISCLDLHQCYQNQTGGQTGRPQEPEPDKNWETNRIKKPVEQKYIKHSYFQKIHIYPCAYMWIQTIIHKYAMFFMYIASKSV